MRNFMNFSMNSEISIYERRYLTLVKERKKIVG